MSIKEVLVDARTVRAPFPASQAVAVGDLCWWDNSAKTAKPASLRTDLGSKPLNQVDFARLFLGISTDQRLATETSTGNDSRRTIVSAGVFDLDCPSQAWEYGDLIGVDRTATPLNYNQQVDKVTTWNQAVGFCIDRQGSSVTKVRCFVSAYLFGYFAPIIQGDVQPAGAAVFPDADTTLVVTSAQTQVGVPTAARKAIMPAAAESKGMTFLFVNNSAGAFAINVRDPGDTTTLVSIPQNKRGIAWCPDGTNWYALASA